MNSDKSIISFEELTGVRCSKKYEIKNNYSYLFDNWRTDLVKSVISTDYDEERRLLFVAITRAKQYVYLTASRPSIFFEELALSSEKTINKVTGENLTIQESNNSLKFIRHILYYFTQFITKPI